jgi:hypothetical protein
MAVLRVASLVVLALWMGGLAVLGFVAAPAIFATLEAADPAGGRALAGRVFGDILRAFQPWIWGLGFAAFSLLVVRSLVGPRPHKVALRLGAIVLMLALTGAGAFYVTPRIDALRNSTPQPIASLADDDPRKSEFGRLHGLSSVLMLMTLAAGVGLLWAETKDH